MSERPQKPATPKTRLQTDYATLLADIKARVQTARIKAGLAANRELLALYWQVGRLILDRQRKEGWGAKVIDRLSADLQREFPGQQGFSPRNLNTCAPLPRRGRSRPLCSVPLHEGRRR